jgi:hypothetical protein
VAPSVALWLSEATKCGAGIVVVVLLQGATLLIILAAGAAWLLWVGQWFASHERPELMERVVVHGVETDAAEAIERALTLGIVGAISEHHRDVAFINEAATQAAAGGVITALTRLSTPTPGLLETARPPADLDIAVEIAGTRVDAKGLQAFFALGRRQPASLAVSVFLDSVGTSGMASSSFPGNQSYGFSLPVSGTLPAIARQIGMRYVQAHYAGSDPFYAALEPSDFLALWDARRQAAALAFKAVGEGGAAPARTAPEEARQIRRAIDHLLQRYRRRPDIQKLGAFLAHLEGELAAAIEHLTFAMEGLPAAEQAETKPLLAAMQGDFEAMLAAAVGQETQLADEGRPALLDQMLAQPALAGILPLAPPPSGPRVRVAVLGATVGDFSDVFGDRIGPLGAEDSADAADRSGGQSFTNRVVSLVAALSPVAEVHSVKVLESGGGGSLVSIIHGLDRVLRANPPIDVLLVALGPLTGGAIDTIIEVIVRRGTVVVAAAGNDAREMAPSFADNPSVVIVGATSGVERASYSNFGPHVHLYAPGEVMALVAPDTLELGRGTDGAAAIVAALAANLIARHRADGTAPTPAEIVAGLREAAQPGGALRVTGGI